LAAGTTYYYQVNSTDSKGNNGHGGNKLKTAGFSMSSTINPTAAGNGAAVALSGPASASSHSRQLRQLHLAGLANGTYTIAPSQRRFYFYSSSQSMAVNGANVTGVNFTATSQTFSISGTISPVAGGSGATVTLSVRLVPRQPPTARSVHAQRIDERVLHHNSNQRGLYLYSADQNVTLSTANVSGVNFTDTAVAVAPTITTHQRIRR